MTKYLSQMSGTEVNSLFSLAAGFVNQTRQHVFITGKAGTGKTTFLKYIKENSFKKIAVVAPTGVAAINAGGVTIHSLFQLPLGTYLPTKKALFDSSIEVNNEHTLLKNIRLNSNKRTLIQELELLVIDEVSMVRADTLDAVDAILRSYRRQHHIPFGGVQVVYIGDLFQLPPVANYKEWELLKEFYKSPFFFDSHALQQAPPTYIELKKIYRQTDQRFIEILNNIRNNICKKEDLEELHQHYKPGFEAGKDENYIILTSHNAKADAINKKELDKLPGNFSSFEGTITGDFNDRSFPVERFMNLKEGAQIMFIKNDKGEARRFYNGKIGVIKRIDGEKIFISFPGEDDELELEKETWRNIRYSYNKEKDIIDEDELGSYTQFPIRLAWAITIHKSQGLTFEKAIIDAGESFAAGQVYVALSRLTSLDGLVLRSIIAPHCISTDERVLEFSKNEMGEVVLGEILQQQQKHFATGSIIDTFNWFKLTASVEAHYEHYEHRQLPDQNKAMQWGEKILNISKEHEEVAQKFRAQLERLLQNAEEDNYLHLHERTKAAAAYFTQAVDDLIFLVEEHAKEWKEKNKVKKYLKDLEGLQQNLVRKKLQIQQAVQITTALTEGLDAMALMHIVKEQREEKRSIITAEVAKKPKEPKPPKGHTKLLSLQQFRQGKTIKEIAAERSLAVTTIEGHLAACVETGEIDVKELVPEEKIETILKAIEETEGNSLTPVKEKLSNDFSYAEIKAVMGYKKFLQQQTVDS